MAPHSGLAASTRRASFTPHVNVLLHIWQVETSLYQGSSLHYSLVSSHGMMMAGLDNLGSERLGSHHLPLGVGCSFFSLAI